MGFPTFEDNYENAIPHDAFFRVEMDGNVDIFVINTDGGMDSADGEVPTNEEFDRLIELVIEGSNYIGCGSSATEDEENGECKADGCADAEETLDKKTVEYNVKKYCEGINWGIKNDSGKVITPAEFVNIGSFFSGVPRCDNKWSAEVMKYVNFEARYGILSAEGKLLLPIEYPHIYQFGYEHYLVEDNEGKKTLRDLNGNVVRDFDGWEVSKPIKDKFVIIGKDDKEGIINEFGEFVAEPIYDWIDNHGDEIICAEKDGKWTLFSSKDGQRITSDEYDSKRDEYIGKIVVEKDGKWGLIDSDGNVVADFIYDNLGDIKSEGIAALKDGFCGVIDRSGNVIVDFVYDEIGEIGYYGIEAAKDGKYGVIDSKGNVLVPFEYRAIGEIFRDYVIAYKDGANGVVDKSGNVVIDFLYDDIKKPNPDGTFVEKDWKLGIVDFKGNVLADFEYDNVTGNFDEGVIFAEKDEKWGLINNKGKVLVDFVYEYVGKYEWDFTPAMKDGKWGVLNDRGKEIIPFIYDRLDTDYIRRILVEKDGRKFFIDKKGNEIAE